MADFGLLCTFARELISMDIQARGNPPTQSLSGATISEGLANGGNIDGRYASGYLYHTARISQTIYRAERCLDLGAAPGCQLLQLAPLHPDTQFIGIDRSEILLEDALTNTKKKKISNVEWLEDDITSLSKIETDSVDAVISTMTLHDLQNLEEVVRCLNSVKRVLKPGGAVYIEDYGRLKSKKSVHYFNTVNGHTCADAFSQLNVCSLTAAFKIKELRAAFTDALPDVRMFSTFLVPFLNVAKTPDRSLPPELKQRINDMRLVLSPKKRANLDDLRTFFRLGGWKNDPFD
jgi:arsenite methyltransferase